MNGTELAAIEILAITLYANDSNGGSHAGNPAWMALPEDDRLVYRMLARAITDPEIQDPEAGYR